MPLKIGCSKATIRENTQRLIKEGYPPKAAYAIANDLARKHEKMCPVNKPPRKPKKKKSGDKVSFKTKSGKRVSFKAKKKKGRRKSQAPFFGFF